MKRLTNSQFLIFFGLLLVACSPKQYVKTPEKHPPLNYPIAIIYDNDVHCAVDNYPQLAALRNTVQRQTPYVTIVSSGDFLQGDLIGAASKGGSIVSILNAIDYDVVTLGNHEFDYGMPRLLELTDSLDATVVCCNLRDVKGDSILFEPYHIVTYGNTVIAYLGIATPATISATSPAYFQDEQGNVKYDFSENDFIANVQHNIDQAHHEGAQYIIALSHLGDIMEQDTNTSIALIQKTRGFDVVLDGHSHSIISDTIVRDKDGKPVLLSSTGSSLRNIGLLTLDSTGLFHAQLIPASSCATDSTIYRIVAHEKKRILAQGSSTLATTAFPLSDSDAQGNRAVRNQETTLGNLCADALRIELGTDIVILNGGGFRAGIPAGNINANVLKRVMPFDNSCCVATMTGQQILDALEYCVSPLPAETGNFPQVSGMKFTIDLSATPTVINDYQGLFVGVVGDRRIQNLQILNTNTQQYEPIDPQKTYTIASLSYLIQQQGSGGMLRYATLQRDTQSSVIEILSLYLKHTLNGKVPQSYKKSNERITIKH